MLGMDRHGRPKEVRYSKVIDSINDFIQSDKRTVDEIAKVFRLFVGRIHKILYG